MAQAMIEGKKDNPHGVQHPARCQPRKPGAAQRREQRLDRHQHNPAHHRINHDRQNPRFRTRLYLLQDADQRQSPDNPEQRPAPRPAQGHQAERRVAAGDQQVDREVIDLLHDRFLAPAHAVVNGRCAVKHQQGKGVDRHADDLPRTAVETGQHNQPHPADKRRHGPDKMRPGVQSFPVIHALLTSKFVTAERKAQA
ncbi:hypothetical protein D3C71_1579870 [compost metagenome]